MFEKMTVIVVQNTSTLSRCLYIGTAKYTTGDVFNTYLVHHRWRNYALNTPTPVVYRTGLVPENNSPGSVGMD